MRSKRTRRYELKELTTLTRTSAMRLRSMRQPLYVALPLGIYLICLIGLFCFTDQIQNFWSHQGVWDRKSVFITIENRSANVISLETSTGFTGRWEKGGDVSETTMRLSQHLHAAITKDHFITALMKKDDLRPIKVLIKLGPLVNYSDFKPILTALRQARIDHYALL